MKFYLLIPTLSIILPIIYQLRTRDSFKRLAIRHASFMALGTCTFENNTQYIINGVLVDRDKILTSAHFCQGMTFGRAEGSAYNKPLFRFGVESLSTYPSSMATNQTYRVQRAIFNNKLCLVQINARVQLNTEKTNVVTLPRKDLQKPPPGTKVFVSCYLETTVDIELLYRAYYLNFADDQSDELYLAHDKRGQPAKIPQERMGCAVIGANSKTFLGITTPPLHPMNSRGMNYPPVTFVPLYRDWIDATSKELY